MNAARVYFKELMAERRKFNRGTAEHAWRTRAARKYVWMMRDIPVCDWPEERA
jgi:hypothetical protein